MLSIWEKNWFTNYDHIIIGSGIVGLTTAYYLQQKFPHHRILILERGVMPTGASTKNAGFACMGSPSELLADLQSHSEEEVLSLFLLRKHGLERLRNLLGDQAIDYQTHGSYELLMEEDLDVVEKLNYLNQLLEKELNMQAFALANHKINDFQLNQSQVKTLIENTCEGQIDTGKMMMNLIQMVSKLGIEIKTGCEVISFQESANEVEVVCKSGSGNEPLIFKAQKVILCNNAFAAQLMPELDVVPGRGQVLITKPIKNLAFKGIFHFHQGYYYFREYQGCVLFGGGRNLDFKTEQTTQFELNASIQEALIEKLRDTILPNHVFEIDLQWAGIMAFGSTKKPIVKQYSRRIYIGVRMGGMGIAIGSEMGFQLANLIVEN
ncbi:MAG: FAD-binding oxidoreductase [Bacteroidetes bacterium]|nr:FAD-binding oxidoreductase [Bacteroidota bacterium]